MAQQVTDREGKSVGTVGDSYRMIARTRPEYGARLAGPGLSGSLRPMWDLYQEISEGRTPGEMGPSVLTWTDLAAWQSVTGVALNGWEAHVMFAIDAAVRAGITPAKR